MRMGGKHNWECMGRNVQKEREVESKDTWNLYKNYNMASVYNRSKGVPTW